MMVSLVIFLVLKINLDKSKVIIVYETLLLVASLVYICLYGESIYTNHFIQIELCGVFWISIALLSIVLFYVSENMIFNVIFDDVLVLDLNYYFGGKLDKIQFMISLPIAFLEECAFRLPLIVYVDQGSEYVWLLIIVSSILFGINHLFFSKYNAVSKCVLGVILAVITIYGESILVTIVLHIIYNYLTSKQYVVSKGE